MLTRRGFIATTTAAGTLRFAPQLAIGRGRWVMKLVYDKGQGAMRVVERWVP